MSPKNERQQCDNKPFFNIVVKGGYSTDRMKRGVVRGISTFFSIRQLLKNCALLYVDAPMDERCILNLMNFVFMDLHCSVPIIPNFR